MKFKDFCASIPLLIMSLVLLGTFGFGFYSFVRLCQQESQKRIEQCTIIDAFEIETRCKKNTACWVIYVTMGYLRATPKLYLYGVYFTKIDADNSLSSLQNRTTVQCMITPCFTAHSENGNDPNTCIFMPNTDFGGSIVLALIFGVFAAGTLSIIVTVLTVGLMLEQAGCKTTNSKCSTCCNKYCWLFACCRSNSGSQYE